ncbi:MAG: nucleotidyl transferase AbiEii/AbiGii toxin family protein [Candidatus Pseudobacter hemicellulosilyticus]|uniref:Nucleotidyl transferase AbiEii/AbiGii toxin family protein n=1 Tax=Candidatus Pseudobacter hemicellulosilyticus TaxID=3121375 RepID=A0AAJ5WPZ8_9BACT|nr:MAG: nucleotidyl transferase AbiEii/AbiGii toxin family protein [Pseudobacter sp.]
MKLHENEQLFREAIQFTAQQMGIPEIFIEKDYWVTFALFTIFKSGLGTEVVFKGGTSLLKCYGLIKRFSEDIDLVVLRREGESNNKLTGKIRAISEIVSTTLPEVDLPKVTVKMGMNRKTAHAYKKQFPGEYGQIRDLIIVEATWLGYYEPYTEMPINSFIYDMMLSTGQQKIAEEYHLLPFTAKVLSPTRTICEKIMSLVRFSYSEDPVGNLQLKIRHAYDLHQLLGVKEFSDFFNSTEFTDMLLKVGQDDVASYKSNNEWLRNHPNESLIFKQLESTWAKIQGTYSNQFKAMLFSEEIPTADQILQTLQIIKLRLSPISWTIEVPEKVK